MILVGELKFFEIAEKNLEKVQDSIGYLFVSPDTSRALSPTEVRNHILGMWQVLEGFSFRKEI